VSRAIDRATAGLAKARCNVVSPSGKRSCWPATWGRRTPSPRAHCHRGLWTLDTKIGRPAEASAELSLAIELYRVMEMTFWLPQAEAARP
jgi:hypothetical protein